MLEHRVFWQLSEYGSRPLNNFPERRIKERRALLLLHSFLLSVVLFVPFKDAKWCCSGQQSMLPVSTYRSFFFVRVFVPCFPPIVTFGSALAVFAVKCAFLNVSSRALFSTRGWFSWCVTGEEL